MFKSSVRELKNVRTLAITGLLIAMYVGVEFLSIPVSEIVFIRFGFVMLCMAGMLFGPSVGLMAGALCDVLAYIAAPKGAYFPGFTASLAVAGMIYGLFLYKRSRPRLPVLVVAAVLVKTAVSDILMNSAWLYFMYNTPLEVLLTTRLIKTAITAAGEIALLIPLCLMMRTIIKRMNF